MRLPVDILDHIFSYLVMDHMTLIFAGEVPVLRPMVDRYLYRRILVIVGNPNDTNLYPDSIYAIGNDDLADNIEDDDRIRYYVRDLQIRFAVEPEEESDINALDDFAETLLLFPLLESITFAARIKDWYMPSVFQAALEDRLQNLPTLKQLCLQGEMGIAISLLDSCKNIQDLRIWGSIEVDGQFSHSSLPRLKSLKLITDSVSSPLLAWLKLCVNELKSLRYGWLRAEILVDLLELCSGTLETLIVDLNLSGYLTQNFFRTGETVIHRIPGLPFNFDPPDLQELVLQTNVTLLDFWDSPPTYSVSSLPAANEIIKAFHPPPQHLVLEINLAMFDFIDLPRVDLSPLAFLATAALSIPRIDLHICDSPTRLVGNIRLPEALLHAHVISSLEGYEDVMKLIKEGRVVIHMGPRKYRNTDICLI